MSGFTRVMSRGWLVRETGWLLAHQTVVFKYMMSCMGAEVFVVQTYRVFSKSFKDVII